MPLTKLADKDWKIKIILFLCSFAIYTAYHYPVFFNINALLSSNTLDTLKNYYTFVYHIKNDSSLLHFSGMNFPYGEHVVYTDCQPILATVLKLFPFAHNHLAGILHTLMFLSFILSPLLLFTYFKRSGVTTTASFFFALGISLLAPQYLKINAGHFGLAYGCIIPLSMLLTQRYLESRTLRALFYLILYNVLLFFLHPYLGFSVSVFSMLWLLFFIVADVKTNQWRDYFYALLTGVLPILIFRVFMMLTDQHLNRTTEPYGLNVMVENITSLISPEFGPFSDFLKNVLPERTLHFEGHSYLGMSTILLSLGFIIYLLVKKMRISRMAVSCLFSALVLLLLSFGWHNTVAEWMGITSSALNQFRATSRFAYFFYYALPVFLVVQIFKISPSVNERKTAGLQRAITLVLFLITLTEAHYFFRKDQEVFWKARNVFNSDLLNQEEKEIIERMREQKYQAILPLPVFHGGSEVFERTGSNNSYLPSMVFSYHSATPILSVLMSRTSITETKNTIEILNAYKKNRPAFDLLSDQPLLVLKTKDELLPDEERILSKARCFRKNDTLDFCDLRKKDMSSPVDDSILVDLQSGQDTLSRKNIIFIGSENRKPFILSDMQDYEKITDIPPGMLAPGRYVMSLHFHASDSTYKGVAANLIVAKTENAQVDWQYNLPLRIASGFYPDHHVAEHFIEIKANAHYEFVIKGFSNQHYRISNFLLRPDNISVFKKENGLSTINNFTE